LKLTSINNGYILNSWVSLQSRNLSKKTHALYFGSVARTREKKTNIAAVIVQKRKEQRREQKYTKFRGTEKSPEKLCMKMKN